MEIAILTSSRADFGFYMPLLSELAKYDRFRVKIVVFGTHLSCKHGYTVSYIKERGFNVYKEIDTIIDGDSPETIVRIIGKVHDKFAAFWKDSAFDLVFCLGDRYEMFAAVSASVPFNIPIAHISGGEETQGAIDNIYRHTLSLMSRYHFTNTKKNAERVADIIGSKENIFFTGSLAIDNIKQIKTLTTNSFKRKYGFDLSAPYILFTFHPETVGFEKNRDYAKIIENVLLRLPSNVLVTMPNADTAGSEIRKKINHAAKQSKHIFVVESLGSEGYYTALRKCLCVLGNSSSGIVEAASFAKYVINIGDRQKGRERGKNVIDVKIDEQEILTALGNIPSLPKLSKKNIYGTGDAAKKITEKLINAFDNIY
ncbi:UDP-N-acetylglucosamine 2-epimerase [Parapedobacter lycopersici]|uniref:UDP-N-acetylglucosamine 2-epimerase n=1 Tax=Parapedobacter lycopersici TaxID=1864939 RepID=UPI00214D6CE2|nr:UDP-N-acetylglucosamine 2-epimerase [Parapedobacter lycopersici]